MYWKIIIPIFIVAIIITSGCVETIENIVNDVVKDNVQKFQISCPDYILNYFEKEKIVKSDTSPFDEASDWHSGIELPLLTVPVVNKISCKMGRSSKDKLYCTYISPCLKEEGEYVKGKMDLIYSVSLEDSGSEALGLAIETFRKYTVKLTMIDCKARTIIKDTLRDCQDTEFS